MAMVEAGDEGGEGLGTGEGPGIGEGLLGVLRTTVCGGGVPAGEGVGGGLDVCRAIRSLASVSAWPSGMDPNEGDPLGVGIRLGARLGGRVPGWLIAAAEAARGRQLVGTLGRDWVMRLFCSGAVATKLGY